MVINEYGKREDPTVVLLAPMMVSGEELCRLMRPYFKGSYHIVAPDQGGHGKAGAYKSADEEYETLRDFLLGNGLTHLALVYGASLGAATRATDCIFIRSRCRNARLKSGCANVRPWRKSGSGL